MGYKLCMAEKSSAAKDIADVIGAKKLCKGYYEGSGYRVTWAVGHLVGLAEPEEYGYVNKIDMWGEERETAYKQLPIIPEKFKLVVLESTKEQFEIIKKLIHDPECDEIINCGDMGAEGHILQWFIREKAGCTKKVRRFCATSMTDEAIRTAMANLRPEEDFINIIKGEFCKKKADWIMGMSMSRVESLKYDTGITVGRVQSPTLYFVVKRYLEVKSFKITDYYGMDAELAEGFHVFWNKDTDGVFPADAKDSEGRVLDKTAAESQQIRIKRDRIGTVSDVKIEKKGNNRPQLFDITELQREANRKYGYSAILTLNTMQALYERPLCVLSYPRTDSRYITSDLMPYMRKRVEAIAAIPKYAEVANKLLAEGLNIDKRIVDDSKVIDHHAIIPTEKIENFDLSTLQPTPEQKKDGVTAETMRNIFDLVITRMLVSFSQPEFYEQSTIKVAFPNGMTFSATGKEIVQAGWKEVQERLLGKEQEEKRAEADAEQVFPTLIKGQTVYVKDCSLIAKKTTPPKLHTEATLLTAMENAGATIENGAILKGKGIGTQATRAGIIEKLFDSGYCTTETKGKTNYIVPTPKGQAIIQVLPQELYSPKITADWETKIALIADGKMTEKEFMDEFNVFINEKVKEVKESNTGIVFKKERETVGDCPWCNSKLYRYAEMDEKTKKVNRISYYCSKEECSFSLATNNPVVATFTGKKLTEKQLQKVIADGSIILTCKSKKGEDYKGKFTIAKKIINNKVYTNLEFSFPNKKGKK